MLRIDVHTTPDEASRAAADVLASWLTDERTKTVMLAAGNTPLDLYRRIAELRLPLSRLHVFALDEYVGVPLEEPRNCANLLRRTVAEAWRIPAAQFHAVSSLDSDALASVRGHEAKIESRGGVDVVVLGLGQNGHLGFNEPGSAPDSAGRVLDLAPTSVEANRRWFADKYAPAKGVTTGLKTILAARRAMLLAFGPAKAAAVGALMREPRTDCPASWLQRHPHAHLIFDTAAAAGLGGAT